MRVLVTGAAGAIGSHMAEALLARGDEVICIDSLTSYYSPQIKKMNALEVEKKGATFVYDDLLTTDLDSRLKGVELILHFAAQPGISAKTPFEDYLQNNIIATKRLLDSAQKSQTLKHFVFASTSSVYGTYANGSEESEPKPTSYYGVTKLAAEQLAMALYRDTKFPATTLRFFSVYGERERPEKFFHKLIKAIHEDSEITLFEGSEAHVRSYTYIKDIIDGCIRTIEAPEKTIGEIFNLGTEKTATTGEGLAIVEELMGKKARIVRVPKRQGDQLETSANISKMRKTLGYHPHTTLNLGLKAEIDWYISHF